MHVIEAERFGSPEVLSERERPDPVAAPGEVVVDVAVTDVLFLDTQLRAGAASGWGIVPPYVPGNGVAGRVGPVGAQLDPTWEGRPVVARTGGADGQDGYASRAVVGADGLFAVPDGVGLPDAAALLHDGATALGIAEGAVIRPGEWVLVLAAGGGLGLLLVQLGHAAGARVVGAARGETKLQQIRELGVDVAIDYSEPGWTERVCQATEGRGPDVVLDGAGGALGRAAFEITAPGGRFSAHGAPGGFAAIDPGEAERRGVTVRGIEQVQYAPEERRRRIERALAEAVAGRLRPVIGRTFPLSRAADAHRAVESREVVGKTLLLV
jgi:NADPH:quinone reductase